MQVTSDGGKVTAYASVLDNITSDPLLVFPVDTSKVSTNRVVVPGVAELNNGAANFHSDMRIFNAGTTDANVTLAYSSTGTTVPNKQVVVPAGQIVSLNNTLNTLWGPDRQRRRHHRHHRRRDAHHRHRAHVQPARRWRHVRPVHPA